MRFCRHLTSFQRRELEAEQLELVAWIALIGTPVEVLGREADPEFRSGAGQLQRLRSTTITIRQRLYFGVQHADRAPGRLRRWVALDRRIDHGRGERLELHVQLPLAADAESRRRLVDPVREPRQDCLEIMAPAAGRFAGDDT